MQNIKFILLSLVFAPFLLSAQQVYGYVRDAKTQESLIGAYVKDSASGNLVTTDAFGAFQISTNENSSIQLSITYLGYRSLDTVLTVSNLPVVLLLRPTATLPTIEVKSEDVEDLVRSDLSVENLPVALLNALPSLAGEPDPIKALQLLPGVAAGVEGTADLYVRGGTPDQNLILLDGAKIYNANHLFGFLSPVNPDLVKNIKLYKSGFPARFGGRLSSVLEIETEGGNKKDWETSIGLGLVNSRFQVSGPLKKDRTSISIGGRTAHLSLLNLIASNEETYQTYLFYDLNVKVNWQTDRSNFSLAFFRNYDRTVVANSTLRTPLRGIFDYGNLTGSARWALALNSRYTLVSTLTGNKYRYQAREELTVSEGDVEEISNRSTIEDVNAKVTLRGNLSARFTTEVGVEGSLRLITPRSTLSSNSAFTPGVTVKERSQDLALFASGTFKINKKLMAETGIRAQYYFLPGTDERHSYLEPRVNISYRPSERDAITASFTLMSQGLHMISNNFIGIPTNLWVTANDRVPPSVGRQISLGYGRTKNKQKIAFDIYYKTASGIIDPLPGIGFFQSATNNWEEDISRDGENKIYGAEFLYKKSGERLFGWLAYNLSWNQIRYDEVNRGEWYFRQFDRRHDLSLVAGYRLSEKWQVIGNFVLNSGYRLTLPEAIRYDGISGAVVPIYNERYNATTPLYHRVDVTFRRTIERPSGKKRTLSLGCYNVYGRQNPTYVLAEQDVRADTDATALGYLPGFISNDLKQFSLFTFIPFINYEVTF